MKGIHTDTYVHHIYMDSSISLIRQPQRRMNPALKNIVKEELQKHCNAGFIYPISDSKWVSPLVVVPNKVMRKWRICVDFKELNKTTLKDYFPFPFIDQVLDTLSDKQYFYFLNRYSGYNQILIALRTKIRPLLHVLGGHMPIEFFHLAYVMHLPLFSIQF